MRNLEQYQKTFVASEFESVIADYRRKLLLERLKEYRPSRVLEVGCGLHSIFERYTPSDLGRIIEPADMFFEHAIQQQKANARISVFHGTLEAYVKESDVETFDFIICSSLIHEIPNVDLFLKNLLSLCSKETVIHVNVPNANSLHRHLGKRLGVIKELEELSSLNSQLEQSHVFSAQSLENKLTNAGLKVLKTGSYFLKPFTHAQMADLIKIGFLTPKLLDAFFDVSPDIGDLGAEIFMEGRIK